MASARVALTNVLIVVKYVYKASMMIKQLQLATMIVTI